MQNTSHPAEFPIRQAIAEAVCVLSHPDDVLAHPDLSTSEKRLVLETWASDAHAVVNRPGLRQLDSGSIVTADEVLRALRALGLPNDGRIPERRLGAFDRRRRLSLSPWPVFSRRRDDDDDPPASPAAALPLGLALALRRKWEPSSHPEPGAA